MLHYSTRVYGVSIRLLRAPASIGFGGSGCGRLRVVRIGSGWGPAAAAGGQFSGRLAAPGPARFARRARARMHAQCVACGRRVIAGGWRRVRVGWAARSLDDARGWVAGAADAGRISSTAAAIPAPARTAPLRRFRRAAGGAKIKRSRSDPSAYLLSKDGKARSARPLFLSCKDQRPRSGGPVHSLPGGGGGGGYPGGLSPT